MRSGAIFFILGCCLRLSVLQAETLTPTSLEPAAVIVHANNQFGFAFYAAARGQRGNLIFSPYSLTSGFAIAAAGAGGDTAIEIEAILHTPSSFSPLRTLLNKFLSKEHAKLKNSPEMTLANALWVQHTFPLLPSFETRVKQDFDAEVASVDFSNFSALAQINRWVSERTKKRIEQLLTSQEISQDTRMVITTALYFKAPWRLPFEPRKTKRASFFLTRGGNVQVNMMQTTGFFPIFTTDAFTLIHIPYLQPAADSPDWTLAILLPREIDGLAQLEKVFSIENWTDWNAKLKPSQVELFLPRQKITEKFVLNPLMEKLGMHRAFTSAADFSGISAQQELFISKAVHEAFLRIDEKGSEAAAATGISMNVTAVLEAEKPLVVTVDHPFLFVLFEKTTGTILLMGRVEKI